MTPTRGQRNKNPLNIRRGQDNWLGQDKNPTQRDPEFYQFKTASYGYRAGAKILRTYQRKYGLTTLAGLISRWAPQSENNTRGYIARVAKELSLRTYKEITGATQLDLLSDTNLLKNLIIAMHIVENGKAPTDYEMSAIEQAIVSICLEH